MYMLYLRQINLIKSVMMFEYRKAANILNVHLFLYLGVIITKLETLS